MAAGRGRWAAGLAVAVAGVILAGGPVRAQGNSAEPLAGALRDVPGCRGEKPETMSMTQGSTSYRWASREYECGEGKLMVMVGVTPVGSAPAMPGADGSRDVEMRSGAQLYRARTLRGFRVIQAFNEEEKSGAVVVMFGREGDAGSLVVQFEGMTLEEAAGRAERFDWAAMQKVAGSK